MKEFVTVFLLFSIFNVSGQTDIRPEILNIVDSIAEYREYHSKYVGRGAVTTDQRKTFLRLENHATNDELKALVNYSHPIIKCYAFEALVHKKDSEVFTLLIDNLKDGSSILIREGCFSNFMDIGDFFIRNAKQNLTSSQKLFLDSVLLFDTKINLAAQYYLLKEIEPLEKYYDRIQEIAKKRKSNQSAIALAKYRKEEDIEIIRKFFRKREDQYAAMSAVFEFPHKAFYPDLIKIFNTEWSSEHYNESRLKMLYLTLNQYNRENTISIFEQTINEKKKSKKKIFSKFLMFALLKKPNPYFEEIKSKIKLSKSDLKIVQSWLKD